MLGGRGCGGVLLTDHKLGRFNLRMTFFLALGLYALEIIYLGNIQKQHTPHSFWPTYMCADRASQGCLNIGPYAKPIDTVLLAHTQNQAQHISSCSSTSPHMYPPLLECSRCVHKDICRSSAFKAIRERVSSYAPRRRGGHLRQSGRLSPADLTLCGWRDICARVKDATPRAGPSFLCSFQYAHHTHTPTFPR